MRVGGEKVKFNVPKGKFVEKSHEGYGRGRGKEVYQVCYGTSCAALRDMVGRLVGINEIKPKTKVREF